MTKIIEKYLDIINKGMHSLKNMKKDKREYKEYLDRSKALPEEYKFVFKKATEYMWSFSGGGDGYDMISLQYGLLELFEESVAHGKHVGEVTGDNVAVFCDDLLKNAKTYTENRREKLNRDIAKKLGKNIK